MVNNVLTVEDVTAGRKTLLNLLERMGKQSVELILLDKKH
jgi:hypothetical protein